VIGLDNVEVAVVGMSDKPSRRVRELKGVLLELCAKFWDLEDAANKEAKCKKELLRVRNQRKEKVQ
jgi:hypothetical protein